eukprot:3262451-Rhodomonas_salina.2
MHTRVPGIGIAVSTRAQAPGNCRIKRRCAPNTDQLPAPGLGSSTTNTICTITSTSKHTGVPGVSFPSPRTDFFPMIPFSRREPPNGSGFAQVPTANLLGVPTRWRRAWLVPGCSTSRIPTLLGVPGYPGSQQCSAV